MALPRIIKANDSAYQFVAEEHPPADCVDIAGWMGKVKEQYGCDSVLQHGQSFFFCQKIIDVDFEEID